MSLFVHQIRPLRWHQKEQIPHVNLIREFATKYSYETIAFPYIRYLKKEDAIVINILDAIRQNTTIEQNIDPIDSHYFFKTKEEVLIMTCSGSGSMEAALINFLRRGDKVLAVSVGNFGDRWRDIAEAYGFQVDYLSFPWGQAADPQAIADKLAADVNKEIKAILVQHHETSTGVYNPLPEISRVRGDHPALLMVDAISGLAACPLEMDAWGLDVVVASSQKALMTPPGLSLIGVSQKAWAAAENSDIPKFYLDLKKAKKYGNAQ